LEANHPIIGLKYNYLENILWIYKVNFESFFFYRMTTQIRYQNLSFELFFGVTLGWQMKQLFHFLSVFILVLVALCLLGLVLFIALIDLKKIWRIWQTILFHEIFNYQRQNPPWLSDLRIFGYLEIWNLWIDEEFIERWREVRSWWSFWESPLHAKFQRISKLVAHFNNNMDLSKRKYR